MNDWIKEKPTWAPRPTQMRGLKLLMENGGVRLFLQPGAGKTSIVLKAFSILKKAGLVDALLVLAPLRVVATSWPQELGRWEDFTHLTHTLVHGGSDGRRAAMEQDADVYLMNVEGLLTKEWALGDKKRGYPINKYAEAFLKGKRFMLVADESTRFKTTSSSRFKTLKKYLPLFERRVILTGTPKPDSLEDLFGQCYLTDMGEDLGQFITHFRSEYMTLGFDHQWMAQKGAPERVAAKIAPTTLQLEDTEAMPLTVVDYWVPMPEALRPKYNELKREFITTLGDKKVMAPNAGVLWGKLQQFCQGAIWIPGEEDYIEIHEAKVDMLENLLEELNGDPLFCLYAYRHDFARINKRLGRTVERVGGGISAEQGAAWCKSFGAGGMPLLLAHPKSAAHGIDGLQNNCNKICWFGLSPSWEDTYQATRRVARSGSKADQVYIYRILLDCQTERACLALVEGKEKSEAEFLELLRNHLEVPE